MVRVDDEHLAARDQRAGPRVAAQALHGHPGRAGTRLLRQLLALRHDAGDDAVAEASVARQRRQLAALVGCCNGVEDEPCQSSPSHGELHVRSPLPRKSSGGRSAC
jgi:hypothetical protein